MQMLSTRMQKRGKQHQQGKQGPGRKVDGAVLGVAQPQVVEVGDLLALGRVEATQGQAQAHHAQDGGHQHVEALYALYHGASYYSSTTVSSTGLR